MEEKTSATLGGEPPSSVMQLINGTEEAFPSGRRKKQDDVESAVGIFLELLRGSELLEVPHRCVTVFGSARLLEGAAHSDMAYKLGADLALASISVMTDGRPGLIEAANRGAKDAGGYSIGCNITLPQEQHPNPYLDSYVQSEHFFVRKVMLVDHSCAFVVMPGAFGTLDEAFEIAILIRTRKLSKLPNVVKGQDFWEQLRQFIRVKMVGIKLINEQDLAIIKITDRVTAAIDWIEKGIMPRAVYP